MLLSACGGVRPLTSAARANAALDTLNAHYYSGGRWTPSYDFWQNAEAFGVLLDAYQRTHAAKYAAMIGQVYAANSRGARGNFTSNSIDDEGWWGLDWTRAWDMTGNAAYLQTARAIFANMAATWDSTCGGGVWWKNHPKQYKNAITNELFLLLAVELHERTRGDRGANSYLAWAQREAAWFLQSGMIRVELVNDGLNSACRNNGGATWTYNQGVILAGLGELYRDTGNVTDLHAAEGIADHAIKYRVDANGVLLEPCQPASQCGQDGEEFKGIFARYLWWLYTIDHRASYRAFLAHSLDALWSKDRNSTGDFGVLWSGPAPTLVGVDAETDTAAAAALNATAVAVPERPRVGPHAAPPAVPSS